MATSDPAPAGVPAVADRVGLLPTGGVEWWLVVLVVSVGTAFVTLSSIQLGCTIAIFVVTIGLYAHNRTAGVVAMWMTWLLTPFLRRIFLLSEPNVGAEPLALAPFLITAVIVALEFHQAQLSARARRILLMVAAGYVIGMPVGFALAPPAACFALFAYLTAAGCFVLGYREAREERPVLSRLLIAVAPFLALYAFRQYYVLPLPEWDSVWRATVRFETGGSSDQERIRVWSTLNAPATFALVMAVASMCYLTARRLNPWIVAGVLASLGALALTYVRSAWLGLALALIGIVLVSRGDALKRVAPLLVVLAVLGPVALGGSTKTAITDRAGTFGTLKSDQSGGDRAGSSFVLIPIALAQPGGGGLGQAGEATRLGGGGIRVTDNGYTSLLLQVGPFGFLLVIIAVGAATRSAWRNAWRRPRGQDLLAFGVVAYSLVVTLFGDQFYGLGGMIFWSAAGFAVRRAELAEVAA